MKSFTVSKGNSKKSVMAIGALLLFSGFLGSLILIEFAWGIPIGIFLIIASAVSE